MDKAKIEVTVKFNCQQLQLLDSLKKERKYGDTYEEIIINIFREYVRQTFGKRGA